MIPPKLSTVLKRSTVPNRSKMFWVHGKTGQRQCW